MHIRIILLGSILSFFAAEGQKQLPPRVLSPMAPLDSLTISAERRNEIAGLRRPSKTDPKNIVFLSTSTRGTKEQDAQYLGQLEKKQVYKVNSSALVSKNVGETEKNLEKVFADAAANKSILFFDDASQLFSKSADPQSTARALQSLAQSRNVPAILWCEDDCRTWLKR